MRWLIVVGKRSFEDRKAEKPKSRKAEKPKSRKAGKAGKARQKAPKRRHNNSCFCFSLTEIEKSKK
jgi:hypothetical protein